MLLLFTIFVIQTIAIGQVLSDEESKLYRLWSIDGKRACLLLRSLSH
jgi:hypothetical protein